MQESILIGGTAGFGLKVGRLTLGEGAGVGLADVELASWCCCASGAESSSFWAESWAAKSKLAGSGPPCALIVGSWALVLSMGTG